MKTASKFELRNQYRETRAKIPANYQAEAATQVANILTAQTVFESANNIAFYLAYKDELSVNHALEAAWVAKKNCYVPVLKDPEAKLLSFIAYDYGDALHKNRFGIYEPINTSNEISARDLDLVIVPLVAFDKLGFRIGTGGGFYDFTFAFLQGHKHSKPILVGAGYAKQEASVIPYDLWDIRLHDIVTEKEWIVCNNSG